MPEVRSVVCEPTINDVWQVTSQVNNITGHCINCIIVYWPYCTVWLNKEKHWHQWCQYLLISAFNQFKAFRQQIIIGLMSVSPPARIQAQIFHAGMGWMVSLFPIQPHCPITICVYELNFMPYSLPGTEDPAIFGRGLLGSLSCLLGSLSCKHQLARQWKQMTAYSKAHWLLISQLASTN